LGDVCNLKSKAMKQGDEWCIKATKDLSFEPCPDERVPRDVPEIICASSIDDLSRKIVEKYTRHCTIAEP